MFSAIPIEVLTMGASALGGFIMKQQAEARKERHEERKWALKQHESAEQSRERAAGLTGGKWIRRILVGAFVLGVIFLPFALAFFQDIPVVVQYSETSGGWLWGLFGPEYKEQVFETVHGFWISPEVRHGVMAIIGFYFGQGAAK